MQSSRRRFLSHSGLLIGAFGLAGKALADSCDFRPTAKQPLGPFYPVEFPSDSDIDLTRLAGSTVRATGDIMIIEGVVTDDMCKPIKGAIVEIWQACHTGRYNHPSDTSGTPLDPHFQYYGSCAPTTKVATASRPSSPVPTMRLKRGDAHRISISKWDCAAIANSSRKATGKVMASTTKTSS
jgi:protocatechuate 3,4-dioxygenase, beta subunit